MSVNVYWSIENNNNGLFLTYESSKGQFQTSLVCYTNPEKITYCDASICNTCKVTTFQQCYDTLLDNHNHNVNHNKLPVCTSCTNVEDTRKTGLKSIIKSNASLGRKDVSTTSFLNFLTDVSHPNYHNMPDTLLFIEMNPSIRIDTNVSKHFKHPIGSKYFNMGWLTKAKDNNVFGARFTFDMLSKN